MNVLETKKISDFFEEELSKINCTEKTKSYIINLFSSFKNTDSDLSDQSVTLYYYKAKMSQSFADFQKLADWIFFCRTLFPNHLKHASEDYYITTARISYYTCYRLINKQWPLFEELSDNFPYIEKETKKVISKFR